MSIKLIRLNKLWKNFSWNVYLPFCNSPVEFSQHQRCKFEALTFKLELFFNMKKVKKIFHLRGRHSFCAKFKMARKWRARVYLIIYSYLWILIGQWINGAKLARENDIDKTTKLRLLLLFFLIVFLDFFRSNLMTSLPSTKQSYFTTGYPKQQVQASWVWSTTCARKIPSIPFI